MRINTNLTAMNTYTQYTKNNNKIASSVEKLSSGYSINSAADNATGLAISEKMRAQIRGLEKASTNSQDAISLVQTAEGSLSESTEILQRMRELSVQSASDTNEDEIDRTALQDEFSQLQEELNDIASNTTFNKKNLLDGSLASSTKKLTNTSLENSGMTIDLGNAATGTYNFSVSTKLESAAVAGQKPTDDDMELVLGDADSYFDSGSVTAGTNIEASDLLNGNYTLSAAYGDDGCITVTAKGDNDQKLTATINAADLTALATGTSLSMTFNDEADDAFSINLTLGSTISSSDNNFKTLATNLSELSVSVSGGVTAQEAQYGVYANLTGAESIKLESGMDSVSFSNGVKVNFDTLTASSVDTENKAALSAAVTYTGVAADDGLTSGAEVTFSNLQAADDSTLLNGAGTIQITGADATTVSFEMLDSDNNSYTCTVKKADLTLSTVDGGTSDANTLTFLDSDGNASFTMDMAVKNAAGGTNNFISTCTAPGTAAAATVEDAGHNYAKVFSASTTDLSASTASSFSVEESANDGLTFQVGANEGDNMTIYIDKMDANYLGVASASVATQTGASAAISDVDDAINQVSSQRAYLGAIQNRLDHKIANLDTSAENLTSAESQIRDVDMAKEMTNFTNANILQQAATAMLAQANSLPQNVLSLIG